MKNLLELIEDLEHRSIALVSLNEQIDTTSANGRLMLRLRRAEVSRATICRHIASLEDQKGRQPDGRRRQAGVATFRSRASFGLDDSAETGEGAVRLVNLTQRSRTVRSRSPTSDAGQCWQDKTDKASPRFLGNWPLTCYDAGSGGRILTCDLWVERFTSPDSAPSLLLGAGIAAGQPAIHWPPLSIRVRADSARPEGILRSSRSAPRLDGWGGRILRSGQATLLA